MKFLRFDLSQKDRAAILSGAPAAAKLVSAGDSMPGSFSSQRVESLGTDIQDDAVGSTFLEAQEAPQTSWAA